ncbi:MAG: stage II sporulation protein M, partial [Firmicutes bacterium]|nr:stage II sporulation protein M [Bacillota bacterium]
MRQGRQNSVMEHLQENFAMYILVTIIFTLGITGGAFSVRLLTDVQIKELNQVFFNFLDYMTLEEPLNQSLILQRSLLQNGVFLLLLWLSGNFFFGSIIGLGCVFYRGFSIGFTVGFLAQQNALQGILFSLGAILPQ